MSIKVKFEAEKLNWTCELSVTHSISRVAKFEQLANVWIIFRQTKYPGHGLRQSSMVRDFLCEARSLLPPSVISLNLIG